MIVDLDEKIFLVDNNSELVEITYINLLERKVCTKEGKAYNLDNYKVVNIVKED